MGIKPTGSGIMCGIAGFTEKIKAGLAGQNAAAFAWRGAFWLSYAPARIPWKKTEKACGFFAASPHNLHPALQDFEVGRNEKP
jgi:hypothetical protein